MSCNIYAPKSYLSYFKRKIRGQFIKAGLNIDVVENGIIVIDKKDKGFGLFDNNGNFVKSSLQIRKNRGQYIPKKIQDDVKFINHDVIYFGNVYPAFGHFLLEHMNRGWGCLKEQFRDAKVVLINNKAVENVPQYMYEFIKLLGVKKSDVLIVNETTQFRRVIVPHQGFNIPVFSSYDFAEMCDVMAKNARGKTYDKVYLSRAALKERSVMGEDKIQRIFEKNGYTILYPEQMPLSEQIAAMRECESLAGCAGTALHLALFMPCGGTVIQLKRNSQHRCNANVQYLINKTKKHKSCFIHVSLEKMGTRHFTSAPQIIGATSYFKDFLVDSGFKYTDSDLKLPDSVWQKYYSELDKYKRENGSVRFNKLKHLIIKIIACGIPGRERRGRFRAKMKARFVTK